jgi:outer membrane protein assembly factor BamD
MRSRYSVPCLLLVGCVAFAQVCPAAVVFRPKDGAKYVAPGDEEMSGNAQELFQTAQAAENSGNRGRAIKAYRAIVRKYPNDALAASAAYRYGLLSEQAGDYLKAAAAYRVMVENYPRSPNFEEAIEAQFRIAEMYLNGKKMKLLGIPVKSAVDKAINIFADIVRSAPYGKYTARAQFGIGLANEKQGNPQAAVLAYQAVVEKFPDHPVAADAQYQIGYLWFNSARGGIRDAKATENAKIGFQDFIYRYPKSEKVPQARENLRMLEHKATTNAYEIAKYYDKQKNYRAAVIYYNDVIRQQPGTPEGDRAKRRVDELRAKVGDDKLQSAALTAATAKPPKSSTNKSGGQRESGSNSEDGPAMRASQEDVAPLPPPDLDESLPPPASLSPGTTLAPDLPSTSASPTPEPSATPEQ